MMTRTQTHRQTDIHSSDFISVQCHALHMTDNYRDVRHGVCYDWQVLSADLNRYIITLSGNLSRPATHMAEKRRVISGGAVGSCKSVTATGSALSSYGSCRRLYVT